VLFLNCYLCYADSALRHLVQTVLEGCSFTFVADCCRVGGLLEGSKEIFGHSKGEVTVTERGLKPWNKSCELGSPTNHPLGIFISSCQVDELSKEVFYGDRFEFDSGFTRAFIRVKKENIQQTSGLYCDDNQKSLMFLGGS